MGPFRQICKDKHNKTPQYTLPRISTNASYLSLAIASTVVHVRHVRQLDIGAGGGDAHVARDGIPI